MHCLLDEVWVQMISDLSILMPVTSSAYSMAVRMDIYELRLQHRGPPVSPSRANEREVIRFECPQASSARGVEAVMIDINIPVLTAAPQAPQKPQAPPGTLLPRLTISLSAEGRSIFPPAFL